ncbi:hypothetical protein MCC01958_07510 [Bifidobacteriaceae bacterium MCC01958]|nr:hypothetical protein MCC01958_07510 [Bifidobacteriaceae bacterium MCC01958]
MRMVTGTTSPSTRYERISVSPASCSIKSEYVIASHAFKPQYKCINYTPAWEQRKFSNLTDRVSMQSSDPDLPQVEYEDIVSGEGTLNKDLRDKEGGKTGIKFYAGDVLYGKLRPYLMNWLYPQFNGVAVGDFWVLRATECDSSFLYRLVQTDGFQRLANVSSGSKMPRADWNLISQSFFAVPADYAEQRVIAKSLAELDNLITLHQRKYDKLVIFKKSMLEKMFPKDGESVPEIRFAGFTDPWEQRKLGELVVIERGGSPRPIDEYITDDTNGLNWVKIGDAPSLGRYISKTSEKIKPEGLSKTRQVHPGDLILSNSMSFGRPYIMAIEGCIHDGWLLIRDEPKSFDPMYLCHMLGTPKMLNQYRMLASGSTVNNLNKELVSNASILMPCKSEQKVIGQFFNHLDDLITLHQRKLELLQNIKKSLLDKMFV